MMVARNRQLNLQALRQVEILKQYDKTQVTGEDEDDEEVDEEEELARAIEESKKLQSEVDKKRAQNSALDQQQPQSMSSEQASLASEPLPSLSKGSGVAAGGFDDINIDSEESKEDSKAKEAQARKERLQA